jgi:hypothetical protein
MTVVIRATILWSDSGVRKHHLKQVIKGTQLAHQTLSLLINIAATSIIALKAWCVCVYGDFVDGALIDDTTRAYMKEIPQVVDGKWDGCPNPYTGSQGIGSPGRVGCDLYFDWCKLRLGIQA